MLHIFQKRYRSPNFNDRAAGARPSLLILHYTGMPGAKEALDRLCDPASQVSAHYLIEENGRLHALVDPRRRAWHAGRSYWKGERDINSHSLGIEIVNPGHEFGYRPFPPAQINALVKLSKTLMKRHGIAPGGVLAHSDVAPARKQDPGELFPWLALASQGVGLWPSPTDVHRQKAGDLLDDFLQALRTFGYDPEAPAAQTITAFHRHYYPELFHSGHDPATPDLESAARLAALMDTP